jgi:predicted phosphodiesterase
MRYGIFSDVHSNLEALESVIGAYKQESIDKYLCVGDVVGYGVNPKECFEKVNLLSATTIAGNHDWASVNLFSAENFNDLAKEAIFWTRKNLTQKETAFLETLKLIYKADDFILVHSTLDNPQDFNYMLDSYTAQESFGIMDVNICFIGHTHVAGTFILTENKQIRYTQEALLRIKEKNNYIVNVGSVGQPRDRNPDAAYCIYDTQAREIQIKRIGYDVNKTREKIIKAGLPAFLGNRLLVGR